MTTHPNYELFEEIGRTETTIVYRAHDLALGRDVAIKELTDAGKADARRKDRLMREAQDLAQTEHPGILRIHTVVPENGWIVMELMRGSLATQIRHSAMDADTVRSIVTQLLSALDVLHRQHKLHGAIRPSNVLIDNAGSVRLSDFEKVDLDGELRPPSSTKKYLAPESIRSELGALGPASDLYCLAFMAFELLAGPGFDQLILESQATSADPEVAWLRKHSSSDPLPAVAAVLPHVPADLAQTLEAMLTKCVDERLDTAAGALKRLNDQPKIVVEPVAVTAASDQEPPGILPTQVRDIDPLSTGSFPGRGDSSGPSKKPEKSVGRRGGSAASAVTAREKVKQAIEKPYVLYPLCALILILALGLGLHLRGARESETKVVASTALTDIPPGVQKPTLKLADSELIPKATERASGPDEREVPEEVITAMPDANDSETSTQPTEPPVERETDYEPTPDPRSLPEPGLDVFDSVEESVAETDSATTDTAPKGPPPQDVAPQIDPKEPSTIGPPSDFMKLVSQDVVVDTAELLAQFKGDPEIVIDAGGFLSEVSDVAIDPKGRWVAACGGKVVRLWDLSSGDLAVTLRGDRSRTSYGDCHTISFTPDGEFLAVGVSDYQPHGSIRVYRTSALDQIEALLPGQTSPVRQLNFSRDGSRMVTADADGNVAVWDWSERRIINQISASDPTAPIMDELLFAGAAPVLLGIDFNGPSLLEADSLRRLTAADNLPSKLYGWMFDLLKRQLNYPYGTTDDPRVVDLKLEQGLWAAAGVGKQDGANRYWVGVWPAREQGAQPAPDPQVVYSGHRWKVRSVDLQPSLGLAASGDMFGEVHVWNTEDGKTLHRFRGEGKPVYEAAFDNNSPRIAFGTKSHPADIWGRNNYGSIDRVLDLAARSIYEVKSGTTFDPIQEKPNDATESLSVKRVGQDAGLSLVRQQEGRTASRYQLTTGRSPTVFSFIEQPALGSTRPVLLGDSEGLLAVWDSNSDELRRAFIGHDAMITSVSVASHGRTLLSGSSDRTIRLWSLEQPVPTGIFDFKFENSAVTNVPSESSAERAGVQVGDKIESIDGKSMKDMYELMLTGEFDYRPGDVVPVRMNRNGRSYAFQMRMNRGYDFSEPILSVYIGDNDHWIVWTPQGYYDASPGSESLIGWHVNRGPDQSAAYFSVGQFREQLYRPDIIDRLINGQPFEEAVREANRQRDQSARFDFRSPSDLALHHPPVVRITSPLANGTTDDGQVRVEATVTSANGLPIRDVTMLVDGIATEHFLPRSPVETEMRISRPLTLSKGQHRIDIVAINAQSRGSESVVVDISEPPNGNQSKPDRDAAKLVVLAISVNDRQVDPAPASEQPVSNAVRFADAMQGQAPSQLFGDVLTRVVEGDQATRSKILDGFQWLIDQTASGDTVAIYLSSDGFLDSSENYYLGAHDVDRERPRATAISWREFVNTLQTDLPSCRRIVFLEIQPNEEALEPGLRNPLLDLAAPELGTIFFSSTALQQRLPVTDGDQSGFLTAALQGTIEDSSADVAPDPPDGLLSYEETSQALIERVQTLSDGNLYPVAFSPAASRQINVFKSSGER